MDRQDEQDKGGRDTKATKTVNRGTKFTRIGHTKTRSVNIDGQDKWDDDARIRIQLSEQELYEIALQKNPRRKDVGSWLAAESDV